MVESELTRGPIPESFTTIEAAAEFWDSHDVSDYEDLTKEVAVTVALNRKRLLIAIDPDLAGKIESEAERRGLSTETLVNLWLSERITCNAA